MITNQMVVMMTTSVKLMMFVEVRMSVPEITNCGNHGLGTKANF